MAAIGRFQKGEDIFYAKVVDGDLFRLRGDVFGSPSFDKKATSFKGLKTLTPVAPTKVIAVGLNYADHARGGRALHLWLHGRPRHQRPHHPANRKPMGPLQILRHLHTPWTLHRNEDRSARPDHSAFPKWPTATELQYQPTHLQLLRRAQFRLNQHDPPARRYHSHRHPERRGPD